MTDCDPYVAEIACEHIKKLDVSEPKVKRARKDDDQFAISLDQLLNDIELALTTVQQKEILSFSDDEDVNFADCY